MIIGISRNHLREIEFLTPLRADEIVGTIAGDDTVMCAIRTVEDTKKLMKKLEDILK